jgi:hypothetical protein
MLEDGWCAFVIVDEEDLKYSSVLDVNGNPFLKPKTNVKMGFNLERKDRNNVRD